MRKAELHTKKLLIVIITIILFLLPICGHAEKSRDYISEFNEMGLEELQNLQTALSEIINNKKLAGATIQFDSENLTVDITKQIKLSITASGRDITPKTKITYESSDPEIAKITGSQLTGISAGTAVIKATAVFEDDAILKTQAHVTVNVPVTSIKAPQTATVFAGSTLNIKEQISISPENASNQGLVFTIDDESIADIDESGIVRGIKGGTTTLTVTSAEEAKTPKTAKCKITVTEAVSSITLDSTSVTVGKQKTLPIKANVLPESATNKKVTWSSADTKIASVSPAGIITGVKTGTTTITCTAADGSGATADCKVTVIQSVSGITINPTSITLARKKTYKPTVKILPSDATNKEVTWKSSSSTIASVDEKGTITAKSGGDCEITCTTKEGEKKATIKVHVPTFSVDRTEYTVTSKTGTTIPVNWDSFCTITLYDNGGSYFDATWTDDNKIKITPNKAGKGTVVLNNENAPKDKITISITIDHSAAYDNISYPSINYDSAARYPSSYKGDKCSFSGKVLQVVSGSTTTSYRISSRGNYDNVVYVTIKNSDITTPVIEDDKVTVYGKYDGNYTYTSIFGANITLPSVTAERINVK